MVHHTRVGRRAAQSAGRPVMFAREGGTRVVGQAGAGAEPMVTVRRVHVVYRGGDGHRRRVMVPGRGGRAGLIDGTGA